MTKQDFIKSKLNSFAPQFKELIGLKESDKTSTLIEFMTMLHPNQSKQAQGSKGQVFGNKHFVFTIYTTGILRTVVHTGSKRFYPIKNGNND